MKLFIISSWSCLILILCRPGIVVAFQQHRTFRTSPTQGLTQKLTHSNVLPSWYGEGINPIGVPHSGISPSSRLSTTLNTHDHAENDEKGISEPVNKDNASNYNITPSSSSSIINPSIAKQKDEALRNRKQVFLALCSLITANLGLMLLSGKGAWRYYLSGGICAAISHGITTPVDVIKTRIQIDESMKDMSMVKSGLRIMKEDGGVGGLLAGLGPTTIGYLTEGAVKFGIYEVSKPIVRSTLLWLSSVCSIPFTKSKVVGFLISGGIAGAAASVMLCPMEALRIRIVAEQECKDSGWIGCFSDMISNEGVKGLWKSLPAMLSKQVPYTVTKNVSFDMATTFAYSTVACYGATICGKTKIVIPLISAMLASILSCIASQPGDMILSVMNAHAQKGQLKTRDFYNQIVEENGIKGLFVGIRERFVHVGLIVTTQLLIYDFVKRLVGIAATGL